MIAQHWICSTGCGHEFYWILSKPRVKRPNCPNCHSFKTMKAQGMVHMDITPTSIIYTPDPKQEYQKPTNKNVVYFADSTSSIETRVGNPNYSRSREETKR